MLFSLYLKDIASLKNLLFSKMKKIFQLLKRVLNFCLNELVRFSNIIKSNHASRNFLRNNPQQKLSKEEIKSIRDYFKHYGIKKIRIDWHRFYSGYFRKFSVKYIPEDIFFSYIENTLNDSEYYVLQDKNLLKDLFPKFRQPETIVQNINGFYKLQGKCISQDAAIDSILRCKSVIIKSTLHSYGGKSVKKIDILGNETTVNQEYIKTIFSDYGQNFIVQEVLNQSEIMGQLNQSSLNTIRVCSYLRESEVVILFSIVRFGTRGSFVDNLTNGGYYSDINDNGLLSKFKYTIKEDCFYKEEGVENFMIPNYDKVKSMVRALHMEIPFFRIISWDIALNQNNMPVLIEYNAFGQTIKFQATNGPLFGRYTDEVLTMIQNRK